MPAWIGAIQIQIQNGLFYINLISTGMMVLTFWYTAGYPIRDRYLPWFSLWMFIGLLGLIFVIVMVVDYKWILPSRLAFTNEQSCKHENPAMDALTDIQKRMARIEKQMGIKDEST